MFCKQCGAALDSRQAFCSKCGGSCALPQQNGYAACAELQALFPEDFRHLLPYRHRLHRFGQKFRHSQFVPQKNLLYGSRNQKQFLCRRQCL